MESSHGEHPAARSSACSDERKANSPRPGNHRTLVARSLAAPVPSGHHFRMLPSLWALSDALGDAGNSLPKALFDLLVQHQVIEDDAKAVDVRTRWDTSVPAGRAIIIIKSAMADNLNAVRAVQK